MKNCIAVLCCLSGLIACESLKQEVDPALIKTETEKIVVACFIAPQDTVLTAEVSLSRPVLGENIGYDKRVSNATITLSDGVRSIVFNRRNGQYQGQYYYGADPKKFPVVAGQRYTLTVQIPDGRKVEAVCTVPKAVVPREVVLDSIPTFENGFSGKDYFVRLTWQDPAGEENFYRVAGTLHYLPIRPNYPNAPEPQWQSTLVDYRRNTETRDLTDDRQRDGEMLSSARGFLGIFGGRQQILFQYAQRAYCTIDLLHVDANYYQYQEAVLRQSQTGDNPFAEPVLVPTNIQGGLGCFGAYNRSTITATLK
ncbi:DUF4249 domain-containing protein [Larkinella humicola]|uniref:DUF4249 domain-containing protein n=1 Tax=Larkinella humicola TaxID=2607654 RepID=A0A5N1JFB7_9BACT|nr:DUF4249 domain-containing protein [Larkinella humicola]KAA9353549.1 DUF4249 domain-containing protein [Larkinella humicola]